ncbi:Phosphoglycerate mutase [Paragonimus heterotremus]|uniref:Fructose-2,6-bisphosphatase TIGAR n=1 Tax=Paragonimus heterotremus TaxID=100268 RepID=A0A8J4SKB8_9TREM|nr:Phosphoglycerate mutase [Paragonimus heterotremus]
MAIKQRVYFYLTLIRHGETNANVDNIIQGHMDTDLSEVGVLQARELRDLLNSIPVDLALSSDLKRANLSATEFSLPVEIEQDSRLRERNFGVYCGTPRRELQKFAEKNSETGGGCDGWKAVGGECSHEMAHRTSTFLLDICVRLVQRLKNGVSALPGKHGTNCPILGHMQTTAMPDPVIDLFDDGENPDYVRSTFAYAGHVLIVSHGGWIRHLLRFLALQSQHSRYFPKKCVNSVMRNCGLCQVGVAFEMAALENYNNKPDPTAMTESPLPVFGTLTEDSEQLSTCRFYWLANRRLPLTAVCYHFNVTKSEIKTKIQTRDPCEATQTNVSPAETLCSQMEVIFSDDGDEYAGKL